MGLSIIEHNLRRFGMVTVMDVVLRDPLTKKPLIELDTLKISNISTEASQKEITGGIGAPLLITYDYGRRANVEVTDALLSMYSLEMLWGETVNEDNIDYYADPIEYTVTDAAADETIDLTRGSYVNTKDSNDAVVCQIYVANATQSTELLQGTDAVDGDWDYAADTITLHNTDAGIADNDIIKVWYLATATEATNLAEYTPLEMVLRSSKFPPTVELWGRTYLVEEKTGKEIVAELFIPKFKINANFSFTMEAEGDASVFDFTGWALDLNDELITIKTLYYRDQENDYLY